MEETTRGGELAKADRTPPVITTAEEFRASLERWQGRQFNVLTPFSNISGLAPSHGILTSIVQINLDKTAGDVYDGLPFLKGGDVALAKNGLRRIAEGLGISTRLEYIAVGIIPNYWHVKAIATYKGIDGSLVSREGSQEWDLRDGSDRLKGWTPNQISEGRKNGLRQCETRAINAAIRECGCGIKQSYKKEELARPFVAVRVMLNPDMSDPEVRRMVTAAALGGMQALYPAATHSAPAMPPAPMDAYQDDEPRSVGRGSSPAIQAAAPLTVVEVTEKRGEGPRGPWLLFRVSFSDGRVAGTFNDKIAEVARKAKATGQGVEALITEKGKNPELEEISIVPPAAAPPPAKQMSLDDVDL